MSTSVPTAFRGSRQNVTTRHPCDSGPLPVPTKHRETPDLRLGPEREDREPEVDPERPRLIFLRESRRKLPSREMDDSTDDRRTRPHSLRTKSHTPFSLMDSQGARRPPTPGVTPGAGPDRPEDRAPSRVSCPRLTTDPGPSRPDPLHLSSEPRRRHTGRLD